MDWSVSKIIRIENSTVGISTSDLKALMLEYGVENGEAGKLIAAAKASREEPWYAKYGDAVDPALRRLLAYESLAAEVYQFQFEVIPGLVQTADYARAVLALFQPAELVERALEARMERQRRFFEDEPWPRLQLLIDENVLMRPLGGVDVMRDQIEHLLSINSRPEVSIAVVPLAGGGHVGLGESFTMLNLEDDAEAGTVLYVEGRGEEYLTNRDDELVRTYWSRYERIDKVADTGEAANATLNRHLAEFGAR